ncbi:MAG: hypothetical protein JWO13_3184 [Acidobacteriales bacterium]|nr:hypothetical protein [Terriglobales bacterium]
MKNAMNDRFKRKRLDGGVLVIESTCVLCGEVLVGDITDGLKEKEEQHVLEQCPQESGKRAIHLA